MRQCFNVRVQGTSRGKGVVQKVGAKSKKGRPTSTTERTKDEGPHGTDN